MGIVAETLVEVRCAVCSGQVHDVVCTAREVETHLEYLRRFHRRRLRRGSPSTALADRADFTQDYATRIVACRECGLLFRSPRPRDSAIAAAYAGDEYGPQRMEAMFRSQRALYRSKARRLRRWLRPGSRVVEVGSFVGGFLAAGAESGWRVLGVDPGAEVGRFCERRRLPVFRGELRELVAGPLPPGWRAGEVDCVAIWSAFDQLPDPEPTLRAARELLRPGGLLAIRVPNGDCFRRCVRAARTLRPPFGGWLRAALAWHNLLAFPYLQGYSVRTLDWLLSWHGLVRLDARPDTPGFLADASTRRWAAWEERLLKGVWSVVAGLEAFHQNSQLTLAPWIDVYYRAS